MYNKNIICRQLESLPCPYQGHVIPFPGDSILFRLPRQPAGASRLKALYGLSLRIACPFFEQKKTPSKKQHIAAFIGCS